MMVSICKPDKCTGCMACVSSCVHHAIDIVVDDEGFDRPAINQDKCVDCGLCSKKCPINCPPILHKPVKIYSGWSADASVRLLSSSGGAFIEIARSVISANGVVFGCTLNEDLKAEHIYVESLKDLQEKLSGSKYVQSKIGNSYKQAKEFLLQGRLVLFSGTPCQIAGLKNYLGGGFQNLLTVDLVCHGVPSPMLFEDYKMYIQSKEGMVIDDIKFRLKKSSWIFFNMAISGHIEKNKRVKKYIGHYYEDPYIRGFLRDYFQRPCCYQCKFTSAERCSDFTIGDWWGYKSRSSIDKGYAYKGVSLILVNTNKALSLISSLNMQIKERTLDDAKKTNVCLSHPYPMDILKRKCFWEDYRKVSFDKIVEKYMFPERVTFDKYLRQHCKNTDLLLFIAKVIYLPIRIKNKLIKP